MGIGRLSALPAPLQHALRLAYVGTRVTADRRSLRTWARLSAIPVHEGSGGRGVNVRLRPLGGRPVALRPSTSDADTVWGTFARRYHLPPPELTGVRRIWDPGANIGLTMADLARRYPDACVLGVELDADNAAPGASQHRRLGRAM